MNCILHTYTKGRFDNLLFILIVERSAFEVMPSYFFLCLHKGRVNEVALC